MAKASLIGLITQGSELQHSAKGEPYVRFSVALYFTSRTSLIRMEYGRFNKKCAKNRQHTLKCTAGSVPAYIAHRRS